MTKRLTTQQPTTPRGASDQTSSQQTQAGYIAGVSGVIIGTSPEGVPMFDASSVPFAVLGPARCGKNTSIIVPSLLTWRESAVVFDTRSDLFELTAHWRREGAGNTVRRLDFSDAGSPDTFNFLEAIPRGTPDELAEIFALAADLLQGDRWDASWRMHALSLLTLFIVAVRSMPGASLIDVKRMATDDSAFAATVKKFCDQEPVDDLGWATRAFAVDYTDLADSERAAVRAIVINSLAIFESPEVATNTMSSTFDLESLRDRQGAMTIYLTCAAHDVQRLQGVIRTFLGLVVRNASLDRPHASAHRLLLVLNDVGYLGRLGFLESSLAGLADHGVKVLLALQDLAQLDRDYGENNSIWHKFAIRTVLRVDRPSAAAAIAEDATRRDQAIMPHELMALGKGEAIVFGAAPNPIRAVLKPYFEHATFNSLVGATAASSPVESAAGVKSPR